MTRYFVTGAVGGLGLIQHVIKAPSRAAAFERFRRAYGKRVCAALSAVNRGQA